MVAQTYKLYPVKGFEGQRANNMPATVDSGLCEDASIEFGKALKLGAKEDGVAVGHDAGIVLGISERQLAHEASTRPSNGSASYLEGEQVDFVKQGEVYIKVTVRAAVRGELLNVVDATGAFSGGSAVAGETASLNVRALESGSAGDIIKVRIDVK